MIYDKSLLFFVFVGMVNLGLYARRRESVWLFLAGIQFALALTAACMEHYLMYHIG